MIPSKAQWKKWSLPSKLTAVGTLLGLLSFGAYLLETGYGIGKKLSGANRQVPSGPLFFEVPENTIVNYDGPSPMGVKAGTYYVEGSLQIEMHSKTTTKAQWKTVLYSFAIEPLPKWNYQGENAIIVESSTYPNIRKHEPSFSLMNGPDPLATLTTTNNGKWELHGLIGEYTGKGRSGGDTDPNTLIAAGTFSGHYTNPTSFTLTHGYHGRKRLGPSFLEGLGTPPLSFVTSRLAQPLERNPFEP